MRREFRAAFTLIELLVVIAVISLLAAMLLPVLAKAKDRGRAAQCLNNLKQAGVGLLLYADENEDRIQLEPLIPGSNTWATLLSTHLNMGRDVFVCPAYKPFRWRSWLHVYAIRRDPPAECCTGPNREFLKPHCIRNPSDFLLLGDSTSQARGGWTAYQYYKFDLGSGSRIIHARHFDRTNGFFLDGHVEPCNQPRLEGLGIPAQYGMDTAAGYFD